LRDLELIRHNCGVSWLLGITHIARTQLFFHRVKALHVRDHAHSTGFAPSPLRVRRHGISASRVLSGAYANTGTGFVAAKKVASKVETAVARHEPHATQRSPTTNQRRGEPRAPVLVAQKTDHRRAENCGERRNTALSATPFGSTRRNKGRAGTRRHRARLNLSQNENNSGRANSTPAV